VPQGALIDEHKAPVATGAFVEVTALLGNNNSLTAVVIVVTRAADDDDDDDDGDDDGEWVEFRGTVSDLPETENLHGDWTVGDKTVRVGDHTEIEDHGQTVNIDDRVKVKGWLQADGSVRAIKIELLEEHDEPVFFIGEIMALPDNLQDGTWQIDEREVVVNESTELDDEHGEFVVGNRVKVYGRESDGTITAEKIRALPAPEIHFTGRVNSLPPEAPDSFVGEWEIGEKTVFATEETELKQENGEFIEGGLVKVKGRLQSDGSVIAYKIETEPLPWIEHVGVIKDLPGDDDLANGVVRTDNEDLLGLWEIGALYFLVTEETELDDEHGEFAVGVVVKATGRMRADGVVVAHEIETKRSHDDDDDDD
jgi:hypothetical protein